MWAPLKNGSYTEFDGLKVRGAKLIGMYKDFMQPSGIRAPIEVFMKTKAFNSYAPVYKKLVTALYEKLHELTSDADKQLLLDIVKAISLTGPQEVFSVKHPKTNELVCTLYTPEDKGLATDVLKNLGGNINYNVQKFKTKRQTNSQEYKDAWNMVIKNLDSKQFDDEALNKLRDAINKA